MQYTSNATTSVEGLGKHKKLIKITANLLFKLLSTFFAVINCSPLLCNLLNSD